MSVAAPTMCAKRFMSADVLPTPGSNATADPKIAAIVDQIEGLTLLQTSELVAQLKVREREGYIKKNRLNTEELIRSLNIRLV